MPIDEQQHVALPKLYGASAYSRPRRPVDETPRPFDPDDLPIAAEQTEEERVLADTLPGRPYAPSRGDHESGADRRELRGRPFRLRAIAGRILRGS